MQKLEVAVVLVDYQDSPYTQECLQSLDAQKVDGITIKTIVVFSQSSEARRKQFRKLFPHIISIVLERNRGFSGSNNEALHHVLNKMKSEYILLLNNDTRLASDAINKLLSFAQLQKNPGIFSPKIFFEKGFEFHKNSYAEQEKGKAIWYAGGLVDKKNVYAWHRGVNEVDHGQFEDAQETSFATGCCMLISREVLEKIGLLDDKFFLYLEDLDYSFRARNKKFHLWYVPSSIIWHKNAGSTGGSGSKTHIYYQTRNRLLFGFKHLSLRTKLALFKQLFQKKSYNTPIEKEARFDFLFRRFGKRRKET